MGFILAQILGGIALVLVCIGYFVRTKSTFLILQSVANFFYASAFFVVGAYVGAGLVIISLFRCLYIYIAEKKDFKYILHFLSIFVVLYIVFTIVFWNNIFDLFPLIASLLFTLGYMVKNLQVMRYILLIPNTIYVLYNILTTTYTSALLDFVEVVVILIAILKFHLDEKYQSLYK